MLERASTSSGTTRVTQRAPGSWLKENGVVPPPGSFPGLGLDFGDTGRSAVRAPAAARGNVSVIEEAPRPRRTAATKGAPAKKATTKKAAAPRKRSDGS